MIKFLSAVCRLSENLIMSYFKSLLIKLIFQSHSYQCSEYLGALYRLRWSWESSRKQGPATFFYMKTGHSKNSLTKTKILAHAIHTQTYIFSHTHKTRKELRQFSQTRSHWPVRHKILKLVNFEAGTMIVGGRPENPQKTPQKTNWAQLLVQPDLDLNFLLDLLKMALHHILLSCSVFHKALERRL